MTSIHLVKMVSVKPFSMISRVHQLPYLAFGFLASQEVKDAGVGNLGLQDRMYLSCEPQTYR